MSHTIASLLLKVQLKKAESLELKIRRLTKIKKTESEQDYQLRKSSIKSHNDNIASQKSALEFDVHQLECSIAEQMIKEKATSAKLTVDAVLEEQILSDNIATELKGGKPSNVNVKLARRAKQTLLIRLDADVKASLIMVCEQKDLPVSIVLRQLINDFLKSNSQYELDI